MDYLNFDIIPGEGAAGVALGMSEEEIIEALGSPQQTIKKSEDVKLLIFESVKIWIKEKTIQIAVYGDYKGKTQDQIGVGTKKTELIEKWGHNFYYNEDDYWEFPSKPGILFDIDENGKEKFISVIYINSINS